MCDKNLNHHSFMNNPWQWRVSHFTFPTFPSYILISCKRKFITSVHIVSYIYIYIYRIMQKTEIWDRKLFVYVCMYVYSLQVKSFYFDYFLHCRYQPKTLNIGSISLQRYAAKKNIDNNCKDVLYGICILYCIATKML